MSLSAKEKIIRALVGGEEMNISELSRATGVSRAVLMRECDLLTEAEILKMNAHRYALSDKILLALLFVHKQCAEILTVSVRGILDAEIIEYLDTFSFEDNVTLVGRRLSEYAEYLRADKYTVLTAAVFDGRSIPDIATLKSADIRVRRADVVAAVLNMAYPNCTAFCLDRAHLTSVLCRGGDVICEGGERNIASLLRSAAVSLPLLKPDILAFVGVCEEDADEDAREAQKSTALTLSKRLCSSCEKQKIGLFYLEDTEAYEVLARAISGMKLASEKL